MNAYNRVDWIISGWLAYLAGLKAHKKEVLTYEDDISAEEQTETESPRFQKENEHSERQKSFSCKKS